MIRPSLFRRVAPIQTWTNLPAPWRPGAGIVWAFRIVAALTSRYELIPAPDGSKYLSRWHLPEALIRWTNSRSGGSVGSVRYAFLHLFHRSDPDRGWHCHPWKWCESRILWGSYLQGTPDREDLHTGVYATAYQRFGRGDTNLLEGSEFHAIYTLTDPVWTFFLASAKHGRSWGFLTERGVYRTANGDH